MTKKRTESVDLSPGELASSVRKSIFAMTIANGFPIGKASAAANVSPTTGYRWASDPTVAALANHYRQQVVRETIGMLAGMGTKAARTLYRLMASEDEAIALKASIAALAEVRKIADAYGTNLSTDALPVVRSAIDPKSPESMADMIDDIAAAYSEREADADGELPPKPPEIERMNAAEIKKSEKIWADELAAYYERLNHRREARLKHSQHVDIAEISANAMAAADAAFVPPPVARIL